MTMTQTGPFPKEYFQTGLRVSTFDVDAARRMKLSSILKYQQEVGELHLTLGGLSYSALYRDGLAFVLSRTRCVIHRPLLLGEPFSLLTWHRDSQGAQFFRCYRFLDRSEQPVIDSVTAFMLIDPETRRVQHPRRFRQYGVPEQPERSVPIPDPEKLHLPNALSPLGCRPVRFSDTDYNGHLNNTVYADLVCDCYPDSLVERAVTSLSISFIGEAVQGDVIRFTGAQTEEQFSLRGETGHGVCFEAQCTTAILRQHRTIR